MRIGIVNAGGNGNLGDELFLYRWQQLLAPHQVLPVFPACDVANVDRIIIGGGDLADLDNPMEHVWHEAFLSRPCFVYGIGTMGKGPGQQLASFLNRCKAVYVRDRRSADKLVNRGARVTGVVHDLLWALDLPAYSPSQSWKNSCGVAFRREYPFTAEQFGHLARAVSQRGLSLQLMPLQSQSAASSDFALHAGLFGRADGILSPYLHPLVQAHACGWPDVLVTTRIHAALFALRAGKRVVPLYFDDGTGNRFTAICEAAGIKGLTKTHWNEQDIGAAIDAAQPVSTKVLMVEARGQQNAFRDEVLLCQ